MKPPLGLIGADSRPRIWFRLRGSQAQFAAHPAGVWRDTDDIISAIDEIGGDGAHRAPAVILWEGMGTDA